MVQFRPGTLIGFLTSISLVHVAASLFVLAAGWTALSAVGYFLPALFGAFTLVALLGSRLPDPAKGVAYALTLYTGTQTGLYWFTDQLPPTTEEALLGVVGGIVLLTVTIVLKRRVDGARRVAKLHGECYDGGQRRT